MSPTSKTTTGRKKSAAKKAPRAIAPEDIIVKKPAYVPKPKADGSDGLFVEWYYLEHERLGSQKAVLQELNAQCGTAYQSNWISMQMAKTERTGSKMPLEVRRAMMIVVARSRLAKLGITREKAVQEFVSALL